MTTYVGNPSLASAVKERVSSTFQHSLALYKQGRIDEVVAGCNLILQMDPLFDPAKKLLEKARNPNAPIDVDSLLPASADDALGEARAAMAARDFQRVIHITTEILTNDLMNDEARILGDQAREKMEASPFVEQFLSKCSQHIGSGNVAAARTDLEKARALDPDHPAIQQIEQMIAAVEPAPAAPTGFGFDAPSFGGLSFGGTPSSDAGTSFVVETPPPASGRGAAQATDFGFTFEEEKPAAAPAEPSPAGFSFGAPATEQGASGGGGTGFTFDTPSASADAPFAGGFSFDTPATPGAMPAPEGKPAFGGDFDFSAAAVATSEDDKRKIETYLADGDRAFQAGDHQQAIDLWSRIFLIDVTNEQASERIEKAKGKRREIEQQAESILATAIQAFEKKDLDDARARFGEVLRLDPNNSTAQDYMERLTETVAEGGAAAVERPFTMPSSEKPDIFADEIAIGGASETAAAPAVAKAPPAKKAVAKAAPRPATALPVGAIAAAVGVLVLGAVGWFVWSRFLSKPSYDPAATRAILSEASALGQKGKYDQAIAMLQDIHPEDPQHDKALVMIADLQHKKSVAAEMIDGRPTAVFYQEQVSNGKAAYESHDFDGAKKAFEQAMRARPLAADVKPMYDAAAQQVAKLDSAKALFGERRYQDALSSLEALRQQDPQNQNIQRMIIDAHFNLGAVSLQEERLQDAIREFEEVLKVNPNDELAKRSKDLAARYNGQQKDLLYKIYVKYLPLRQVT